MRELIGVGMIDRTSKEYYFLCRPSGQIIQLGFFPESINNAGQIVGSLLNEPGVIWLNGQRQTLFAALWFNGQRQILPFAPRQINDHGQIAGTARSLGQPNRACLYSGGQLIDILPPGPVPNNYRRYSSAISINNAGEVLVSYNFGIIRLSYTEPSVLPSAIFVYKDGQTHPVTVDGYPSFPEGFVLEQIADSGQIIGSYDNNGILLTPKPAAIAAP
jgi:hypothetical protein